MPASNTRRSLHLAAAFVLLLSQLMLLAPSTAIGAPGVTVNSTGDAPDANHGNGLCDTGNTNSEGAMECTFRAALEETNANVGIDEIWFSIPTSDPGHSGGFFTLTPATVYPDIGSFLSIDASTQPGFSGAPIVILDGSLAANISSGTDGLLIAGHSVTIRGFVIRDFPDDGIEVHGDNNGLFGNHVHGNDVGVLIEAADNNTVGGPGATDRNVIYSNSSHGVGVDGSSGTVVHNNLIGLDAASSPAGNAGHGVYVWNTTSDTLITGNVISANSGDGVALANTSGTDAAITDNSIYANGGLGIDLGDNGHTGNDGGDGDSGPNGYLNHPTVTSAEAVGSTTQVAFTLNTPNGWYRVDFFANPSGADPSGYGEGQAPVASAAVEKTASVSSFSQTITASTGDILTTTATRCSGSSCSTPTMTSEFSAAVTIIPANLAPVLGPISDVSVAEGDDVTFTVTATDPDTGDSLTFELDGAPAGASIDPDSGEFAWSTGEADGPGAYTFDIRVTDDGTPNLTDTHTIEIVVGEVNQPPTLTDPGDHEVDEQAMLTFTVMATDPDTPTNTLTFGLDGAPTGAAIDPVSGVFSWTPGEDQGPGSYTFDVNVGDGGTPLLEDTVTIVVDVAETNQGPEVVSPGDQAGSEGETVSWTVAATDLDEPANTLTYSAVGLPPGLSIDAGTGLVSGMIDYTASSGSPHATVITVTDDGTPNLETGVSFSWSVADTNRVPTLDPVPDTSGQEQTLIAFMATASDPDLEVVTFDLVGEPSGASIDPITGEFRWTPTEAQGPGTYTFDIVVTDSGSPTLSDSETIRISVTEGNRPPMLTDLGDQTIDEQTLLMFTAPASDPDLPVNALVYSLVDAPAGASISGGGIFTWTPTEAQGPASYTFTVRVMDSGSLVDTESVTVTVIETPRTPVVVNPGNLTTPEGEPVDIEISATDADLPANTLTYSATELPAGLSIHPITGAITGTVDHAAAANSPHTVTVRVADGTGQVGSTTFTWFTPNTNRPPVLSIIPDQSADEETTLRFTAVATDPDSGTILTYSISGAPAGAAIDPQTGVFTWTTNEGHGPSTHNPTIAVTDNGAPGVLTDSQTVTMTINETNKAPLAVSDAAETAEDTAVRIDLLGNDSDPDHPANDLFVMSVARSSAGGWAEVESGGTILYHPRANYHGTVTFTYRLSDGRAETVGMVHVTVSSVNDAPVAGDDLYRLSTYTPAVLPILANDTDVDGERLTFTLTSIPLVGSLRVEGDRVVYDPENGWTGSVTFGYEIHDPHGASSRATVEILVGAEVLVEAQELASELGVDVVPFEPPAPNFDAATLSLLDLDGITLLADSFFQTVGALRIPLGFLGVTVVMVVGFGATSEVPALVFGARRRHWSVVRLGRQQRLPAYSEPGGRKVVYNYDPTAAGIISNSKPRLVGTTEWVPVDTPNGPAWIYRKYLTEQVDIRAFVGDRRPVKLVHELARRLRDGKSIDHLVSDRGLMVALTGSPSQIAPDELSGLMGDKRLRNLPGVGNGLQTPEHFTVAVAQPFLEAYDATPEVSAAVAHSRSALIPTECWNLPYLALGTGAVQPWLVFFEYTDGKAVIAGLGIDE